MINKFKIIIVFFCTVIFTTVTFAKDFSLKDIKIWETAEWIVEDVHVDGNPFDATAKVHFQHQSTGQKHITEMFYDGVGNYCFRFTGTQPGKWIFQSESEIPNLNNLTGQVTVAINPDPHIKGFLTHVGNKFAIQMKNSVAVKRESVHL